MAEQTHLQPSEVREVLARHVLTDGMKLVLDLRRSRGSRLLDAQTGQRYLDMYTFFASAPLGLNPPGIADDPTFMAELAEIAVNKPANPDMYSTAYAEFVETFVRVLGDPALPYLFFIEGGALAVENALKVAFDWKSRKNEAAGRDRNLGTQIMHLTHAFHGRSGYTLSLTNTEPNKTDRFPKFNWPRIDVPAIIHPLHEHLDEVIAAEERACAKLSVRLPRTRTTLRHSLPSRSRARAATTMRPEFLQAMLRLVHAHDALFILDEVQTGVGTTGTAWAYQQLGIQPDVVAFSKKAQVGGIMAGGRVDEVPDHVFKVSGRINSTWGGGLVDMVRSRRAMEIIEAEGLIEQAGPKGEQLVAGLEQLRDESGLISNVRGRGLFVAFDLESREERDAVVTDLRVVERVIVLPCGERSIRFRPALSVSQDEIDEALGATRRSVVRVASKELQYS